MNTIPVTKRGAEKLREELHRLKTVDRPWVINAISEARAQGDLSENAEYEVAKDRQGFIEGRIQEIEGKLSAAQIIDPTELDAGGKVVFGATVELEEESTGEAVKYQIVGEDEADLDYQKNAPQQTVPFPAGSVWVCFSDQTSHAVMSGQYMLEQTLHLPAARQYNPEASPLAILSRLTGRTLV